MTNIFDTVIQFIVYEGPQMKNVSFDTVFVQKACTDQKINNDGSKFTVTGYLPCTNFTSKFQFDQ